VVNSDLVKAALKARELAVKFKKNFNKFSSVPQDIIGAGPEENYFYNEVEIAVGE
jgi:hypothetical protein